VLTRRKLLSQLQFFSEWLPIAFSYLEFKVVRLDAARLIAIVAIRGEAATLLGLVFTKGAAGAYSRVAFSQVFTFQEMSIAFADRWHWEIAETVAERPTATLKYSTFAIATVLALRTT